MLRPFDTANGLPFDMAVAYSGQAQGEYSATKGDASTLRYALRATQGEYSATKGDASIHPAGTQQAASRAQHAVLRAQDDTV